MKNEPVITFLTIQAVIILLLAGALASSNPAASRPLFILGLANAVLSLLHAFIIRSKVTPVKRSR